MAAVKRSKIIADKIVEGLPKAIEGTLELRHTAGLLKTYDAAPEYCFEFVDAWNAYVEGGFDAMPRWQKRNLISDLVRVFGMWVHTQAYRICDPIPDDREAELELIKQTSELIAKGNDPLPGYLNATIYTPVATGTFYLSFTDWEVSIFQQNPNAGDPLDKGPLYIPLAPVSARPIVHTTIDFPTGDLLVTDWVRIQTFTSFVDDVRFEVDKAVDRVRRTLSGVERYNLIEVSCDGLPRIVQDHDGAIRIGNLETDEHGDALIPELEDAPSIACQYRAATIIDREDLARILSEAGAADPEGDISVWLASEDGRRAQMLKVAPGTWHLQFVERGMNPAVHKLEDVVEALPPGLKTRLRLGRNPVRTPADCTDSHRA